MRTERGGRALTEDEEKKLLAVYPPWMRRLAEFADETCLSQGDLLRVTGRRNRYENGNHLVELRPRQDRG